MNTRIFPSSFLILAAVLVFAGHGFANPAAPGPLPVMQSDGSFFWAQARGSEQLTWMETLDGYTILKKNQTWVYAYADKSGELLPSEHPVSSADKFLQSPELKNFLLTTPRHLRPPWEPPETRPSSPRKIHLFPTKGSVEEKSREKAAIAQPMLLIMVSFSDRAFTYSPSEFTEMVFTDQNSVKDFYLENSRQAFEITPAEESQGAAGDGAVAVALDYAHPNFGHLYNASTDKLVADAFAAADPHVDYGSFDTDGNGRVTPDELAIVLYIAGFDMSLGGLSALTPRIWPHRSSIDPKTHDSVDLSDYAMVGELHGTTAFNTIMATMGPVTHELGHLFFDLPDLYDRDQSSRGIGDWGLMGGGGWNSLDGTSGTLPAHFSAWCKAVIGFSAPTDILFPIQDLTVLPSESNPAIQRLWVDPYRTGEHFLLEYRGLTGFDAGLPGKGLLIWHVDPAVSTQNDDESHKLVDLEEADGLFQLDNRQSDGDGGDPYPGNTANTVFDNSSNPDSKAYDGSSTMISVESISQEPGFIVVDITPKNQEYGTSLGYDEKGVTNHFTGYDDTVVWTAVRFSNDTEHVYLDGFEIYLSDRAKVDFYWHESITNGVLGPLLYSQTGFSAQSEQRRWVRFILDESLVFMPQSDGVMVLKIATDSNRFPAHHDTGEVSSGRCYIDNDGAGPFFLIPENFNQHILVSGGNDPPEVTQGSAVSVLMSEDSDPKPFSMTLLATDPDGDLLTWSLKTTPTHGQAFAEGTGNSVAVGYTPQENFWGTDELQVQVHDEMGESDSISIMVTVESVNDLPAFATQPTTSATQGQAYSYDMEVTDVETGDLTITGTYPPWLDLTDNGDRTARLFGTPANVDVGEHAIVLTATDLDGGSVGQSFTLTVTNVNDLPQVAANGPANGLEGEGLAFTGTATDLDPGGSIASYSWDFGDGSPLETNTLTPVHVYNDNGVFHVELTATDELGASASAAVTVTVVNQNPSVDAGGNRGFQVGEAGAFQAVVTDPGTADTHTVDWDFGDGARVLNNAAPAHTYDSRGMFTVTVTATDDDGGQGEASFQVHAVLLGDVNDDGLVGLDDAVAIMRTLAAMPSPQGLEGLASAHGGKAPGLETVLAVLQILAEAR